VRLFFEKMIAALQIKHKITWYQLTNREITLASMSKSSIASKIF
jgi:hypothetical protein